MDRVTVVDIWLLGERKFPLAHVKLPAPVVEDLPELLACAQALNPAVSVEGVVRSIWRLGAYRLRQNLLRRIPVSVRDLPGGEQG